MALCVYTPAVASNLTRCSLTLLLSSHITTSSSSTARYSSQQPDLAHSSSLQMPLLVLLALFSRNR
eukprot:1715-Heterococcus_DN1.PRE.3